MDHVEFRVFVSGDAFTPYIEKAADCFIQVNAQANTCTQISAKENSHSNSNRVNYTARNFEELPVLIRVYNEVDFKAATQKEDGRKMEKDDFAVFSCQAKEESNVVFSVKVVVRNGCESNICGRTDITSKEFKDMRESVHVLRTADEDIIGEIKIITMAIAPWKSEHRQKALERRKLDTSLGMLYCGHRGLGRNRQDHSLLQHQPQQGSKLYPENTIIAFQKAAERGIPWVEFDVHVTKDLVPIVYHNFEVTVGVEKHSSGKNDIHEIGRLAINNLIFKQLQTISKLKLIEGDEDTSVEWKCEFMPDNVTEEYKHFPTLQEVLRQVPEKVAFNIEMKYPQVDTAGCEEMSVQPVSRGPMVDALLDVIFSNGGQREILFSAFDPYIAIMLRSKQNRYPVLLANYGKTDLYNNYAGPLFASTEIAIALAISEGLDGLSAHANDFLANSTLAQTMHKHNLVICLWGEETNKDDSREKLRELGVHILITDRLED